MESHTIFHRILRKEVPSTVVFENDAVLGILDIHPRATTHVLFLPKEFLVSIAESTNENDHLILEVIRAARYFAEEKGIRGYTLKFHTGVEGGQEVPYLHLHFLSDQAM